MEINNLKDLAFYCIRNLNPCEAGPSLTYITNNARLTMYSVSNVSGKEVLHVSFCYDYYSNINTYKYFVSDAFDLNDDEIAEFKFTCVCAKNDLFDAGLKVFLGKDFLEPANLIPFLETVF